MSNPNNNKTLTVAAIQMNSQQNIEDNLADIKAAIIDARAQGAQLVVLPENCCSMGRQFATAERFDALSATIAEYARTYGIYVLAGSLPCPYRPDGIIVPDGRLRQVSLLFAPDGTQVARYDKIHLFTATVADKHGSYNEAATFEPGTQTVVTTLEDGVLLLALPDIGKTVTASRRGTIKRTCCLYLSDRTSALVTFITGTRFRQPMYGHWCSTRRRPPL